MKSIFGLSKKAFISISCIAVALIASGIVIGVSVSRNSNDKDGKDTSASDRIKDNGADAGSPDKGGSLASAENDDSSVSDKELISVEDAKKIALADAEFEESQVSFTKTKTDTDNNVQVYDIEFSVSDTGNAGYQYWYEYEIDATNGSIIEKCVDMLNTSKSSSTENSTGVEYISVDKAKEIVLKDAGLSAENVKFIKSELSSDKNIKVYDIEFTSSDKKYEYEVNAVDGKICEIDIRLLSFVSETDTSESSGDRYIGLDSAKKTALKDANVNSSDAVFIKTRLESDDGVSIYDIEFKDKNKKYDYEINAVSGEIVEKDVRSLTVQQTSTPSGDTSSYIDVEEAKKIALSDANVSASNVTFTKTNLDSDDRTPTYDIEFSTSDKKYDYEINALNGSIIEKDVENITKPNPSNPSGNSVSYIGTEKAKQIALDDANVSASSATFTKTKLDSDDRTPTYDIEFSTSDKKYDYEINALNGNIIEKDIENITKPNPSNPSGNSVSYIGTEKAKQIALDDANVSASNVTFTKTNLDSDDRTPTYDIEFSTSDKKYDYEINATNGNIIEKDIENIRTQQSSTPSNNTNNYIGIDKAKGIALSHAGLSESDVRFTKSELDRDDGRHEYEIEFVSGRMEYEYTIDAVSGKILEHDSDYDD